MDRLIASLPMYDWPERRAEVDAEWAVMRDRLRAAGVAAPDGLVRRNADMPVVPGGIRDAAGAVIAPDPASLPPDELDMATLWRHPALILAQTCWGPMETGLEAHVRVVGQPDYDAWEGGRQHLYSSAIVMRRDEAEPVAAPDDGSTLLPFDLLRGRTLAYNSEDSMSGLLALKADLASAGAGLDLFGARLMTGAHRASIRAVAEGRAAVAAIDCRSWALALRHEPAATGLRVVGWTKQRRGLPYITSTASPHPDWASIIAAAG